jgi:endonuclease V-like protein UPF0215 family
LTGEHWNRGLRRLALHNALPKPLRTAHLIAGGVTQLIL